MYEREVPLVRFDARINSSCHRLSNSLKDIGMKANICTSIHNEVLCFY